MPFLLLLIAACLSVPVPALAQPARAKFAVDVEAPSGELRVAVARLKDTGSPEVLVSSGVPFAPGQLKAVDDFAFYRPDGTEIPVAAQVLGHWPQDRSIRAVLVQFRYPVPQKFEYITFKWGTKRTEPAAQAVVPPTWDYPEGYLLFPAEWLCHSEVVGEQVPFGQTMFPAYDDNIVKFFATLRDAPETGNLRDDGYYSTPHVFYQIFARTGELEYFQFARRELIHYREYQIIQEGKDRGRSIVDRKPRYIYIEAMADDYFLTGDPRSLEVAGWMAEWLKANYPPERAYYPKDETRFFTERIVGFPMLNFLTYYELTLKEEYLRLADEYMKNLVRTQMEWPERGGFIHNLYSHDPKEGARKDEYGGSPFMTGLLLEAIVRYHRLTGSEAAARSIERTLDWLIKEGLANKGDAFKYTTADKYLNSRGEPDLNLLIVHAFGYGYRLSGYKNQDYLDVGSRVFETGIEKAHLKKRKHFNQNYRSSGRFLAYIKDGFRPAGTPALATAQETMAQKNLWHYEDFDYSLGRFQGGEGTKLSIDKRQTYLNGSSLGIKSSTDGGSLQATLTLESWNLESYPFVSLAYKIPEGVPVALRVQTEFGDWLCLASSENGQCTGTEARPVVPLADDGQWHEATLDIRLGVQSVLPKMTHLTGLEFATGHNAAEGSEFWIDDFRIRK